jgi:hypothetical protein
MYVIYNLFLCNNNKRREERERIDFCSRHPSLTMENVRRNKQKSGLKTCLKYSVNSLRLRRGSPTTMRQKNFSTGCLKAFQKLLT